MKKYWIPWTLVILMLSGLLLGAVTTEDLSVVRVDNFQGLRGGLYSASFSTPTDLINFEIRKGAAGSYLIQRQGFGKLYDGLPHGYAATHLSLFQSSSQEWVVVFAADTLYMCQDPDDGWANYGEISFVPSQKGFMFKDTLILSDGSNIIKMPPFNEDSLETDWVYTVTMLHQDRLYGAGADGKIVWGAEFDIGFTVATFLTNDNAGFVYVGSNDEDIAALHSLGSHLVAYTKTDIYRITISPTTNAPYEVVNVNANIGVLDNDAVTSYMGKHYFLNEDRGVYSFDGSDVRCLSTQIDDWFLDSTWTAGSSYRQGCIVAMDDKLFVSAPVAGADAGDGRLFVYDIIENTWTKFTMPVGRFILSYQRGDGTALKLPDDVSTRYGDSKLIFTSGKTFTDTTHVFIYPWGNKDTSSYVVSQYIVRATDLGDMWNRKQVLRASMALQGSGSVQLGYYADSIITSWNYANTFTAHSTSSIPMIRSQEVNPKVEGAYLGIKMQTASAESLQIYGLEFGLRRKGAGITD